MNRTIPTQLIAGAALLGSAIALPAAAQFAGPESAIKYRKAAMSILNTHVGRIFAMTSGRVPFDAKAVAENAEVAAALSKWQFAGFIEGSGVGDTKAEPRLWTEMDKFRLAASKSQEDLVKLNAAAKGGNPDAIKVAIGEVGKSCKACHDVYRKE